MRLENTLALTEGKLLNTPVITTFANVCVRVEKVKRGDLFICQDTEVVPEAIARGAYGIMCDRALEVTDNEIAWIQVESTDEALTKLLRFYLLEHEVQAYKCNSIVLGLALQVITLASEVMVAEGELFTLAEQLFKIETPLIVLFNPAQVDERIFATAKEMPDNISESIQVVEQTLFETSFVYENKYYERQTLSPFFIPYLEVLLHFYKVHNLRYKIRPFKPICHFEAVFTDRELRPKEFGTSHRVLIFEPDFYLFKSQVAFMKRQATWAKIVYLIPESKEAELDGALKIFTYKSNKDIISLLKNEDYHFALIAERDKSVLEHNYSAYQQLAFDF